MIFHRLSSDTDATKSSSNADPRNLSPRFPSHAKNVFRLYTQYLKAEFKSKDERECIKRFEIYVLAMSLRKLVTRIEEPQWKGRTTETLGMRAFLENENPSLKITGSPKFSANVAESFLAFVEDVVQDVSMSPEVEGDLRNQRFTINVAIFFHCLLKRFFNTIRSSIQEIFGPKDQKKDQKHIKRENIFQTHITDVYGALLAIDFCKEELDEILKLYIESIPVDTRPPSPVNNGDKEMEESDDDDVIEEKTWPSAYRAWISRAVRQIRATSLLTNLNNGEKNQFIKVQFSIVEQSEPDQSMEAWRKTVRAIYADEEDQRMCDQMIKLLNSIAGDSASVNKSYSQLTGGNWEQGFRGAIHCEAMIAVAHAMEKVSSKRGMHGYKLNLISRDHTLGFPDAVALLVLSS